jgi:putative tryptophan/tyrosine transport system substrate-binding protein
MPSPELGEDMQRREFITLLGGTAAAWPLAARGQQPARPVIGYLSSGSQKDSDFAVVPFRQGLEEAGFVEGRNVAIEYRWGENRNDRLPGLAADLVGKQPTVIVATSSPAVLAAKAVTATIPIVFHTGFDPIAAGLVTSLNRPGGNLTGVTTLVEELAAKQLEVLHELVPTVTVVALLVNPDGPLAESTTRDVQAAARTLGLQLQVLHARSEREFETVFATLAKVKAGALMLGVDAFFNRRIEQLVALTIRHVVPTMYHNREFPAAGGLMSYGTNLAQANRQVGIYTGRILKNEKPGDLPVIQATRVELIINLRTAKALGITFPITLLGRADEVIE